MSEGKTSFMIFFEVIIGTAFMVFICAVAVLNSDLWIAYERSEQGKAAFAEYAAMAAYDKTTVRGQDIISLITSSEGDPFVVVTDNSGHVLAKCYDGYTGDITLTAGSFKNAQTCSSASRLVGQKVSGLEGTDWNATSGLGVSSSVIQDWFLNGAGTNNPGHYSRYNTYLVYESEESSEIIGVIAERN